MCLVATSVEFLGTCDFRRENRNGTKQEETQLLSRRSRSLPPSKCANSLDSCPTTAALSHVCRLIAEPLTRLTKKRTRMEWGYEAECAMEELKECCASRYKDWQSGKMTARTRLSTDASNVGMGALIEQQSTQMAIGSQWLPGVRS